LYVLAVVKPPTVIGLATPTLYLSTPPFDEEQTTRYDVIALPPLLSGARNDTVSGPVAVVVDPDTALTFLGGPGTLATVTAFEAADAGPAPTAFVALTEHVYVLPALSDGTDIGLAPPLPLRTAPPLPEVHDAVYCVIAEPPSLAGGVKRTDAVAPDKVVVPMVGAPGTVWVGTKVFDDADTVPVPTAFVAVTVQV
jgi:hypothetical protein